LLITFSFQFTQKEYILLLDKSSTFCEMRRANGFRYWALGRAGKMLKSRKNPKPEKYYLEPQNPTNPLHALFSGVLLDG